MSLKRLLAVDPSLTCSGWALFSVELERPIAVGKVKSLPPSVPLSSRLLDLQTKISSIYNSLEMTETDVLICESQTTMRDPGAAFKVEQVRGIFESLARERAVRVPGRINPRSVQYEVMGLRGKQLPRTQIKEVAVSVVQSIYGESLRAMGMDSEALALKRHQDIIDAILVGSLGLSRIKSSERMSAPLESFFEERGARSRKWVAK